jgi:hypothetical protein
VKPPTGGIVIAYVDARLVVEHLNKVCPHLWRMRTEIASLPGQEKGLKVKCHMEVDGIPREDVGVGTGPEAYKAAHSDALKRCAKLYGVGVSLHAIPQIKLFKGEGANNLAVRGGEKAGFYLALTEDTLAKLREGYQRWLDQFGIQQFGQPLDHGDVEFAAGDPASSTSTCSDCAVPAKRTRSRSGKPNARPPGGCARRWSGRSRWPTRSACSTRR